jgi:hypothetical protein
MGAFNSSLRHTCILSIVIVACCNGQSLGSKRGFLKDFSVDSFGYSSSLNASGMNEQMFSPGNLTDHNLECPYCVQQLLINRSRSTLKPFGATGTTSLLSGRGELSIGFGGLEAWQSDGSKLLSARRGDSYNDAWLIQEHVGSSIAVDRHRRVWLGTTSRYLTSFGENTARWKSFSGNATFKLGSSH